MYFIYLKIYIHLEETMSTQVCKRIINVDMKAVQNLGLSDMGIHVLFNESDVRDAYALIIGPEGTPYEDGLLYFRIRFPPDYPFSPPSVQYDSTSPYRIHPNLYVGKPHHNFLGKVCLSIINTWSGPKWTAVLNIAAVLISIQSLLCNNPITNEPGYEKPSGVIKYEYNRIVYHDTVRHLIMNHSVPPKQEYEVFLPVIVEHFKQNMKRIVKRLKEFSEKSKYEETPYFKLYNIHATLNFPEMYKKLIEWSQKYL